MRGRIKIRRPTCGPREARAGMDAVSAGSLLIRMLFGDKHGEQRQLLMLRAILFVSS